MCCDVLLFVSLYVEVLVADVRCGHVFFFPGEVKAESESEQKLETNLKTIPLCIMWTFWLERNARSFENQRLHIYLVRH